MSFSVDLGRLGGTRARYVAATTKLRGLEEEVPGKGGRAASPYAATRLPAGGQDGACHVSWMRR